MPGVKPAEERPRQTDVTLLRADINGLVPEAKGLPDDLRRLHQPVFPTLAGMGRPDADDLKGDVCRAMVTKPLVAMEAILAAQAAYH